MDRHQATTLHDISLDVRAGELVGIYGARGSGKTTLLQVAAGRLKPTRGTATFAGRSVTRQHERIALVTLNPPPLADLPIEVHVALPLLGRVGHRRAQRAANEALTKVGAAGSGQLCWSDLPASERPLALLAHALVRQPRVLLTDDITRGLGATDRRHLTTLLRELAEDDELAVLAAVSDPSALSSAHHVAFLTQGRLIDGDDPAAHDQQGAS
ncbi:MAG: ATP-binding cassette domain-containing protein [Solirubrobacterales bacterium]|nr:ATP-binding cassette domain-containing protein [Solirubrobacterales bacterium]